MNSILPQVRAKEEKDKKGPPVIPNESENGRPGPFSLDRPDGSMTSIIPYRIDASSAPNPLAG